MFIKYMKSIYFKTTNQKLPYLVSISSPRFRNINSVHLNVLLIQNSTRFTFLYISFPVHIYVVVLVMHSVFLSQIVFIKYLTKLLQ